MRAPCTMCTRDGSSYTGEVADGRPYGEGEEILANGDQYVGEYKQGDRNGQGTLTWPDGGQYVGEWQDGQWAD